MSETVNKSRRRDAESTPKVKEQTLDLFKRNAEGTRSNEKATLALLAATNYLEINKSNEAVASLKVKNDIEADRLLSDRLSMRGKVKALKIHPQKVEKPPIKKPRTPATIKPGPTRLSSAFKG